MGADPTHDGTVRSTTRFLPAPDYALDATLDSGQAFGWQRYGNGWEGVIGHRWVTLHRTLGGLLAEVASPIGDWFWLEDCLQTTFDLRTAVKTFPKDSILKSAVEAHFGLRVLRQQPWTCLASFLLSATKQITQIREVYHELCRRFGEPVETPPGHPAAFSFPSPNALASAGEAALRQCRMGFRARYLHQAACSVAKGLIQLEPLRRLTLTEAREILMHLPGVGRKIANCVLLFSCDQPRAFPIDVWIARTLRTYYFERHSVPLSELQVFAEDHFGPHAGLAQQYLFHYARRTVASVDSRPVIELLPS